MVQVLGCVVPNRNPDYICIDDKTMHVDKIECHRLKSSDTYLERAIK